MKCFFAKNGVKLDEQVARKLHITVRYEVRWNAKGDDPRIKEDVLYVR